MIFLKKWFAWCAEGQGNFSKDTPHRWNVSPRRVEYFFWHGGKDFAGKFQNCPHWGINAPMQIKYFPTMPVGAWKDVWKWNAREEMHEKFGISSYAFSGSCWTKNILHFFPKSQMRAFWGEKFQMGAFLPQWGQFWELSFIQFEVYVSVS